MRIKVPTNSDLSEVREVIYPSYEGDFDLPNDRYIVNRLVVNFEDSNDVIAYACLSKALEATLLFHPELSRRFRIEILDKIIEYYRVECRKLGYDWCYIFAKDRSFVDILKKHYGFKDSNGRCLYLGV